MRWRTLQAGVVWGSVLVGGCVNRAPRPVSTVQRPAPPPAAVEVMPGRIALVNPQHRYVVIDFGSRPVPALGTRLPVWRDGMKVGLVRIAEPVKGRFATGDVVEGELKPGDEVR